MGRRYSFVVVEAILLGVLQVFFWQRWSITGGINPSPVLNLLALRRESTNPPSKFLFNKKKKLGIEREEEEEEEKKNVID